MNDQVDRDLAYLGWCIDDLRSHQDDIGPQHLVKINQLIDELHAVANRVTRVAA